MFGDFAPRARGIVPEKKADDCEEDKNEGRQRKDCVVSEGRAELGRFVAQPFRGGLFEELESGAEKRLVFGHERLVFQKHS